MPPHEIEELAVIEKHVLAADLRVGEAIRRVDRQRERVADRQRYCRNTAEARALLGVFEAVLASFRRELDRLVRERKRVMAGW